MKKILIHSLVFYPDGVSTAYLYTDIALGFKERGFDVTVLTTTPHYNYSNPLNRTNGFAKRLFGLYYTSKFQGINIYHIPQSKYRNVIVRVLGFTCWHFLAFIIGLFKIKFDIILSPSPPLSIGLVSIILGRLKKARVVYNVQEVYPDLLINQNQLNSKLVLYMLRRLEKFVYDYSDMVITIDKVFYKLISTRFKDSSKLHIIPNFVDVEFYKLIRPFSGFKGSSQNDHHLKIMYAGNIGHAQNWELLLEVAEHLKQTPVCFYIIGDGAKKEDLLRRVKSKGMENIKIFPYQNVKLMPSIISFADLHFIFMNEISASQGFPSKVYSIMACSKPLIVYTTNNSPLYGFLNGLNVGYLFDGNYDKVIVKIENAINNYISNPKLLEMHSSNARNVILKDYAKDKVVEKYIKLIAPE